MSLDIFYCNLILNVWSTKVLQFFIFSKRFKNVWRLLFGVYFPILNINEYNKPLCYRAFDKKEKSHFEKSFCISKYFLQKKFSRKIAQLIFTSFAFDESFLH